LICAPKRCGNYREVDAYELREPGEDQIPNLFDDPKLMEAEIQPSKVAKLSHTDVVMSRRPRQLPLSNGIHKAAQPAKDNKAANKNSSIIPQAPAPKAPLQRPVKPEVQQS